ncbi:hypothetical protein ACMU_15450 [Actibacterium mucosum KCTC 23349]|uniref:Uncharacterized protein n=1 Tax=Actibacterium mucosum KCTC 23349 TaxID=1454373 RepID=A0A037ZF89_9RHOB|nr:hypothetical protein ACMU_15450 [Actibacterium mucosum KCTC 23349]
MNFSKQRQNIVIFIVVTTAYVSLNIKWAFNFVPDVINDVYIQVCNRGCCISGPQYPRIVLAW